MRRKSILGSFKKHKQKYTSEISTSNKNQTLKAESHLSQTKSNLSTKSVRKTSGDYGTRGTIEIKQTLAIVQKTILRQEAPFADTCLPKTMKVAIEFRDLLFPYLKSFPSSWSFIDKVFVMLAPIFHEDIVKFYTKKGSCMAEIYSSLQNERFDKLLVKSLLEKIEAIKLEKLTVYKK